MVVANVAAGIQCGFMGRNKNYMKVSRKRMKKSVNSKITKGHTWNLFRMHTRRGTVEGKKLGSCTIFIE